MNSHFSQSDNQLERKKLSKAFEGFQGHEELKDSLPHCLSQSGALLLQSPTHPLHCYVYVVGYLKDEISVKHLSKLVTTTHRDSKDYIRHVYKSCCCHFQWNTCFSSCLYDVLKKSTFTALFATNTGWINKWRCSDIAKQCVCVQLQNISTSFLLIRHSKVWNIYL